MTDQTAPTLTEWLGRLGRDIERRERRAPQAGQITTQGPRELAGAALRAGLDLRWTDDGELHARRADSISTSWYRLADADGAVDTGLVERWARERGAVPDDLDMRPDHWAAVAADVLAIARRERDLAARTWSTVSVADALARRMLTGWSARLDGDRLVGHERRLEPSRADVAEHEARMSSLSPVNRLLHGSAGPTWPHDVEITTGLVADWVRTTNALQTTEATPEWADVVTALRAEVERAEQVIRRRAGVGPADQPRRAWRRNP